MPLSKLSNRVVCALNYTMGEASHRAHYKAIPEACCRFVNHCRFYSLACKTNRAFHSATKQTNKKQEVKNEKPMSASQPIDEKNGEGRRNF